MLPPASLAGHKVLQQHESKWLNKGSQVIDIEPALVWVGNFYTIKNVYGVEEWMRLVWCRLEMQMT